MPAKVRPCGTWPSDGVFSGDHPAGVANRADRRTIVAERYTYIPLIGIYYLFASVQVFTFKKIGGGGRKGLLLTASP